MDIFAELDSCQELSRLPPYQTGQRVKLLASWASGESLSQVPLGRVRDLGETANWLLTTCVEIAKVLGIEEMIREHLSRLATEAHYGVPYEVAPIAQLRVLRRSEVIRLFKNDKGKSFTSPHQILDTDPAEFIGIITTKRVLLLKDAISKSIGDSFQRKRTGHALRAEKIAIIHPLIISLYDTQGLDFERAIEALLNVDPISLNAQRFTRQRKGEPDIQIIGRKGTVVIAASASEDFKKLIPWDKAREVLGSVGFTGRASNYITIGKPDFHERAIKNAQEVTEKGQRLLLVPVDVLAELCLKCFEGKITQEVLLELLETRHAYISRQEADTLG